MRLIIFSTVFLLIGLASCKPRKAIAFKDAIVQKEQVAFNIVAGENGAGDQKLQHLVKEDYKGALTWVDREEEEFNKLVKDIEALPAEGIKQGNELKAAAVDYYVALKELQIFDRVEITHREASLHMKGEALDTANHRTLQLSLQKQDLYKKVYEKESVLSQVMEKFNSANGI